jgi:tetratricopeptide (TPR) repeat protein
MIRAALIAVVLAGSTVAHADAKSEAILLFDQGIKEMKAGQFEKACNSFERSIATYSDSGTKGSLARCYEKLGRLASSWKLWRELADLAPSGDLRRDAAAQAAKLEPKIGRYVIKLTNPPPDLAVTINGSPTKLTDVPVPIDAGGVIVRAYAAGRKDWSTELSATDGGVLTIEIPELAKVEVVRKEPELIVKPPPPPPPPSHTRKYVGLGLIGVGTGAIVVGTVFGFKANSAFQDAQDLCGGSVDNCIADRVGDAQTKVDDARSAGTLSTVMFVAGGAAAATGLVLYLTAPKATETRQLTVRPLATPSTAGVVLSGRF